ncbi:hypothetical protein BDN72DRAFT_554028 [Pluteus cervinus]|uniref:Uncharacterized protein n=1 Tax=Pluteus cervinus TaxID=181527 RepID=A0ACD3A3L0_9AGAR|nr:hypothetical protein BDN72DRAFT_554028 [Pluteus cervinus]
MHSLSGLDSQRPIAGLVGQEEFGFAYASWLVVFHDNSNIEPYKDRVLCLIRWMLSDLSLMIHDGLKKIQTLLGDNGFTLGGFVDAMMPRPELLDDNDKQFIMECYSDLVQDKVREKDMPAEYPKGTAEMVKDLLAELDPQDVPEPLTSAIVASTARALRLPETFDVYELFIGSLATSRWGYLCSNQLKGISGISLAVRDAASYASEVGKHASALQWSDQGRSKVWDWFFHSRLTIDQAHDMEPIVAEKLKNPPRWIDTWAKTGWREKSNSFSDPTADVFAHLPGLDRFLRPKTPAEIMAIAETLGGYIVYLNASRYSSHALVVRPGVDDVVHVPLPDVDYFTLRTLSGAFMKSPRAFLRDEALMERKGHAVKKPSPASEPSFDLPPAIFLGWLWIIVAKPVLERLGIIDAQTRTSDKPRIWWCPSGPLTGLPIHAAGMYTEDGQPREQLTLSHYVVSSYFPSASALAYATRPEDPSQKFSLLTIANPKYADFTKLPGTELELEKIQKHIATKALTRGEATVEAVKREMEDASWVHFACHGVAKPSDPMDSALILTNDARLTLREISNTSLPHAQFAYLSACQTAKGMDEAPDQSAHLTAGMLACGYRSVIGTMWKISDEYAPFVADRVYERMLDGGRPDHKRAAFALHDAVQALRAEHKVGFETWVPFIHVGV